MVQGIGPMNRMFAAMPAKVEAAARRAMEAGAEELVAMMKRLAPFADIRDSIAWTWGKAPKGAVSLLESEDKSRGLRITVYSTDFRARWFEFGTAERVTKAGKRAGKITAAPFFFPAYRSVKKRIRSRITREMKKAIVGK